MAPSTSSFSLGRLTLSDPFGNFQDFLDSNHVDGILGIGDNAYGSDHQPV